MLKLKLKMVVRTFTGFLASHLDLQPSSLRLTLVGFSSSTLKKSAIRRIEIGVTYLGDRAVQYGQDGYNCQYCRDS